MDIQDAASVIKLVEDKESNLVDLHTRMDNDYAISVGDKYPPAVIDKIDTHEEAVTVISTDALSYGKELQKGLVRSNRVIEIYMAEVEGSDERTNISKFERLFDFCFTRADRRLHNIGLIALKDSLAWYAMYRGTSAVRILNDLDKNNLSPYYLPLDPRWLTYEYNDTGLDWVNHKTFRTKADLEASFGYSTNSRVSKVYDFWKWDGKRAINGVACNGDWIKKPKSYKMRRLPFIITPVNTRPAVSDEGGTRIAGFGDSIYSSARSLIPIMNKVLTMWMTWANILANVPLVRQVENPDQVKEIELYQGRANAIVTIGLNEKFTAMGLPEVSQSLVSFFGHLLAMFQRATAPFVIFGDVNMPSSGTSIESLKEAVDKAYFPYLSNLDTIYTNMCYLIEEQLLDKSFTFGIEGVGRDKKAYTDEITPVDIKRPHVIQVKHIITSKFGELQALQMAQMAKLLGFPDVITLEKYLNVQDPERFAELKAIEILKKHPAWLTHQAEHRANVEGQIDFATFVRMLGEQSLTPQGGQPMETTTRPEIGGVPAEMGAGMGTEMGGGI